MCKKLFVFVSLLAMVSCASGQDMVWTGAAGDGLWSTPGNWNPAGPPLATTGVIQLQDQTFGSLITIDAGTAAVNGGDIWGPEFGMDLDIIGGSLTSTGFVMAPVAVDEPGRTVINLADNGRLNVVNLLLGDNWWFVAPYVTMNMYSGTANVSDWVWLGGYLNLYGGTMDITGGFNMAINTAGMGLTKLDIHDGTLIIRGSDYTTQVNDWIADGYLTAYGQTPGEGVYDIIVDTTCGDTVITAIPEPSTMALLCLGGLALHRVRRKR